MSLMEATAVYKRGTPLRANSTVHKEDLEAIRKASRPIDKAARLTKQRQEDRLVAQVDAMLFDLQGRKKRYRYDHAAAQQLEHIWQTPFDPVTQVPLWRELLMRTKDRPTNRETFIRLATDILRQFNLHNTDTAGPAPSC